MKGLWWWMWFLKESRSAKPRVSCTLLKQYGLATLCKTDLSCLWGRISCFFLLELWFVVLFEGRNEEQAAWIISTDWFPCLQSCQNRLLCHFQDSACTYYTPKNFGWESRSDLSESLHEVPKADELAVQINVQSRDYYRQWALFLFPTL